MYIAIAELMNGNKSIGAYPTIYDMSFEDAVKYMKSTFPEEIENGWHFEIIRDSQDMFSYSAINPTLNTSMNLPTYVSIKNQEVKIIKNNKNS